MTLVPHVVQYRITCPWTPDAAVVTRTALSLRCNKHYAYAVLGEWWDRATPEVQHQVLALPDVQLHTWAMALVRLALVDNAALLRDLGKGHIEITMSVGDRPPDIKVVLPGDTIDLVITDPVNGIATEKTVWPPQGQR